MSAFLIDQKEYRKFAVAFKYATNKDVEELANELYQINVKAVNYRYKKNIETEDWKPIADCGNFIKEIYLKVNKYEKFHLMAKLNHFIDCAVYQCSEGEENTTAAIKIEVKLKRYLNDKVFQKEIIHDFGDFNL